jgi:plasmid stabilization system protein ParE
MYVTFNRLAEQELNDAIQYYERAEPGLGDAFLTEVRRCTAEILEFPEASQVVRGKIRRRLCRRFPYGLLYTRRDDEIRILVVMNLKRHPTYWLGRT